MTDSITTTSDETQIQPDLLGQVEAQRIFHASLDMLDALECLLLYQGQIGREDLYLDIWQQAIRAVKKAGGALYLPRSDRLTA